MPDHMLWVQRLQTTYAIVDGVVATAVVVIVSAKLICVRQVQKFTRTCTIVR